MAERLDRGTLTAMVAMSVGIFIVAVDFTSLYVAIPDMQTTYGADLTTAQWVINAYALVFGVVIVTGGRLADMFGRRRMFFIGSSIFAAASLGGALAPDIWSLLACRAVMGLGGALMWPAVIGMTFQIVPEDRAGLAGGLLMCVAGIGNAVGPLIGGILTDTLGWPWIFFINVPITVVGAAIVLFAVASDRPEDPDERIDYLGTVLLSGGLFALLLALDWGVTRGWTDLVILCLFALAVILLVWFFVHERRNGKVALIPDDVMTNLTFVMATLTTLLIAAIFLGALLYLPQFMTDNLGFSAIQSGVGLLPMMLIYAAFSFVTGRAYDVLGPRIVVSAGTLFLAGGMFMLAQLDANTTYRALLPGMLILGIGIGVFYASIVTAGVTALDASRSSLASAIIYMANVAGGAVGLGLNTAIVASAPSLPQGIATAFTVNGGLAVAATLIAAIFLHFPRKETP